MEQTCEKCGRNTVSPLPWCMNCVVKYGGDHDENRKRDLYRE